MNNFKNIKTVYFVGIKGVAMSALAILLRQAGIRVFGSDIPDKFPTEYYLKKYKIPIKIGFNKKNIKKSDLVIFTGAHQGIRNEEVIAAQEKGIEVLPHGRALPLFMRGYDGISIAGCHGKTTTSALIATLLSGVGFDPCYTIGTSELFPLGEPGHFGKGNFFVTEADEYLTDPNSDITPRFLYQEPKIIVFTSIDFDHPDAFRDINHVKDVFFSFSKKLPPDGLLVANVDDANIKSLLSRIKSKILTYGFSSAADLRIEKTLFLPEKTIFRPKFQGIDLGDFSLRIPGRHNVLNACAAALVSNFLGIEWDQIKRNLNQYLGSKRRFEKIGQVRGVMIYDDYAHHPTAIKATLNAVKMWFPENRLIAIFQPHTYSRTRALFREFARSFDKAERVLIADIYPSARESFDPTISSRQLVEETAKTHNNVFYKPTKEDVIKDLKRNVQRGDIILTMGAGDIFSWGEEIIKKLS